MGLVTPVPIVKHIQLHVCTDGSSSSNWETAATFDKTIYRRFSMQDDLKTLTVPVRLHNEFDRFLSEAINKTANAPYNVSFDSLNTYLGSLGVTNGIC